MNERKKYILVFFITVGIFVLVFLLNSFLNKKKIEHVSDLQQQITVDLIANETQFDLLKNAPCEAILSHSVLSQQLDEIGNKLSFLEENQGSESDTFLSVKKYYSLLEVKDYLLSEEVAQKCDQKIDSIIYLYGQNCSHECTKQGYVLTEIKRKYPWIRIYSFDLDLDFSIIDTFTGIYDIQENPPILIINQKKYNGFYDVGGIENLIPNLEEKNIKEKLKRSAQDFILDNKDLYSLEKGDEIKLFSVDDNFYTFKVSSSEIHGEKDNITIFFDKENNTFTTFEQNKNSNK